MSDLVSVGFTVMMIAVAMNAIIASYGIFARPSIIKKILSLIIFSDSINVLAIAIGFRIAENRLPIPPILTEEPRDIEVLELFAKASVDPLPQAFVITAIVINFAIVVFLLGLAVLYYKYYHFTSLTVPPVEEEYEEVI